jgi:hypothetical protein
MKVISSSEGLKKAILIMVTSWKLLLSHKQLFLFQFLKFFLISCTGGTLLLAFTVLEQTSDVNLLIFLLFLFVFIGLFLSFIIMVIITFLDISTISSTFKILDKKSYNTSATGLTQAWQQRYIIVKWVFKSFYSFGWLHQFFGKQKIKLNLLILKHLSLGWIIDNNAFANFTFFVTPIIAYKAASMEESINKSFNLIKEHWKIVLPHFIKLHYINNVSLGLTLFSVGWMALKNIYPLDYSFLQWIVTLGALICFIISSVSIQMYKTAAYNYIENRNSGPFNKYFA